MRVPPWTTLFFAFSGSFGIYSTYSVGTLSGIQNLSCVPFPHAVGSEFMTGYKPQICGSLTFSIFGKVSPARCRVHSSLEGKFFISRYLQLSLWKGKYVHWADFKIPLSCFCKYILGWVYSDIQESKTGCFPLSISIYHRHLIRESGTVALDSHLWGFNSPLVNKEQI